MAAPRFNPLHYGEGFLTADTRLETILPSGFNPLHYGEGFLTRAVPHQKCALARCFNPLHYGEGFLTRHWRCRVGAELLVSIPCITGRVS